MEAASDSLDQEAIGWPRRTRAWQILREGLLGRGSRASKACIRELTSWARLAPAPASPSVRKVMASLQLFDGSVELNSDAPGNDESPIFLLSTGWRAGSTLLQRILMTDTGLLLWGEPLGEMVPVSRMTEMMTNFISERNLAEWRNQPSLDSGNLSKSWIANLYPPGESFRIGLRSVFDQWMGGPAREHGFARWGFKEVRVSAADAILLHWLYPKAKFLVISRHPYDCYRSHADAKWGQVYDRYPEVLIDSAAAFARHWNRLAVSWATLPAGFPIVSVKYEDLIDRKIDFRSMESWLGIKVDEDSALSKPVGGTATRSRLSWYERWIISHEAATGMRALGYTK